MSPQTGAGLPAALLARAAEMRVGGSSWDAVAREVGRAAETVKAWPRRFAKRWRAALEVAERQLLDEAAAESVLTLRKQLRSDDEKVGRDAAQKLIQYRLARRKPKPAAKRVAPTPAAPLVAYLESLTDAQLDALIAELTSRGAPGPPGPPGAGRPE